MTDEPKWGVRQFRPGDRVRCVGTGMSDWYPEGFEADVLASPMGGYIIDANGSERTGSFARWELADPSPRNEWFAVDFSDTTKDLPAWLREDGVRASTIYSEPKKTTAGFPACHCMLDSLENIRWAYRPAPTCPHCGQAVKGGA